MKRLILKSTILAAAAVLLSAAVYAQPLMMRFSIPFGFSADEHYLAAGDYLVRWDAMANKVVLERKGESSHFLTAGIPGQLSASEVSWYGKLVFHKYGDRYYLHAFQRAGDVTREWLPSRAERESAKSVERREVALLVR